MNKKHGPTAPKRHFFAKTPLVALLFDFYPLVPNTAAAATFLATDVTTWIGDAEGPGKNQAFLVLDWADGQPANVWGYRWDVNTPKTGGDLLGALVLAEPRFTLAGLATGFVENLSWNADQTGPADRFRGGYDAGSGTYWNYFVNNTQQNLNYTDGAAPTGAHVLPPLGSPFDEAGPGAWFSSNTGLYGRPLANGSWDGLIYADFTSTGPGFPVNAPAIAAVPEPGGAASLGLGMGIVAVGSRRRRPTE